VRQATIHHPNDAPPSVIPPGARLYFLGIGGIGMSALARYFKLQGHAVSGYDRTETPLTQALQAEGIPVYYEQDAARIAAADVIVRTPAVKDGVEVDALSASGKPVYKRAEVLGMIARSRRGVAVAGTHGKTTTTSLLSHLMVSAGLDPTCFVGGIAANLGSNFRYGQGAWVVAEADEFDRSFLQLWPEVAVLTSTDADHLDIYGSADGVSDSYAAFLRQVDAKGTIVLHEKLLPWFSTLSPAPVARVLSYGQTAQAAVRATEIVSQGLSTEFSIEGLGERCRVRLRMPGLHNVENAVAAATAAVTAGATPEQVQAALESFAGVKRRFEVYVDGPTLSYVDDYAHHPAELDAVIAACRRAYPERRLCVVFQPHLFTRTRDFFEGFAESLSRADRVVLLPIYPAREQAIAGVSSDALAGRIASAPEVIALDWAVEALVDWASQHAETPGWVLLTAGAGDIDTLCEPLANRLRTLK